MKLALSLLGILLAAFGGFLLWFELHSPPVHNGHLWLAAGIGGVGLLLIDGVASALAAALTALGTAVSPYLKYLPWMKGGT